MTTLLLDALPHLKTGYPQVTGMHLHWDLVHAESRVTFQAFLQERRVCTDSWNHRQFPIPPMKPWWHFVRVVFISYMLRKVPISLHQRPFKHIHKYTHKHTNCLDFHHFHSVYSTFLLNCNWGGGDPQAFGIFNPLRSSAHLNAVLFPKKLLILYLEEAGLCLHPLQL